MNHGSFQNHSEINADGGHAAKKHISLMHRITAAVSMLFIISGIFIFSSSAYSDNSFQKSSYVFFDGLNVQFSNMTSDSLASIHKLDNVYRLNWNEDPCPKPNPACFDGNDYEDETIKVVYYVEELSSGKAGERVHFAEVWIKHPTQMRTGWASRRLGDPARYSPEEIAQGVNAVIAVNCDLAAYRSGGFLRRQDVFYRNKPTGNDVLLIDEKGDFHIMDDYEAAKMVDIETGDFGEHNIYNTVEFGPSLVVDGEIKYDVNKGYVDRRPKHNIDGNPRTAIGQLGDLHYLLCVGEGRGYSRDETTGLTIKELAQLMYDKGCVQAYNLDGGASNAMIIGGELVNIPMWGSKKMRPVSDIFYFATAVPESNWE